MLASVRTDGRQWGWFLLCHLQNEMVRGRGILAYSSQYQKNQHSSSSPCHSQHGWWKNGRTRLRTWSWAPMVADRAHQLLVVHLLYKHIEFQLPPQNCSKYRTFGISKGDEKILKMAEKGREAGEHKSLRLTISFILLRLSKNSQL